MATQQIHKSKRHADPFKTKTGKDKLKALSMKKLYELLDKAEVGKKKSKIAKEIARRTPIE
jgi:23S rRNA U2552 (ribose-2'-O)-methylase RlmE/FtsJ